LSRFVEDFFFFGNFHNIIKFITGIAHQLYNQVKNKRKVQPPHRLDSHYHYPQALIQPYLIHTGPVGEYRVHCPVAFAGAVTAIDGEGSMVEKPYVSSMFFGN